MARLAAVIVALITIACEGSADATGKDPTCKKTKTEELRQAEREEQREECASCAMTNNCGIYVEGNDDSGWKRCIYNHCCPDHCVADVCENMKRGFK